jgi:predicted membrane channel-forming protein YqfA (hemolysin III family)
MNPDEFCTSDSWSPLTSASANSHLAGVLGGFLITAIALLFARNSGEGVHTLTLFASAVLVLMLDSFLFSLITGSQVPTDGIVQASVRSPGRKAPSPPEWWARA